MNFVTDKFIEGELAGSINIADEVITSIIGAAVLEVEGVESTTSDIPSGIVDWISKKNVSKGVSIKVEDDTVEIDVSIIAKYGYKLHETAQTIQNKVKNAVEAMTGLKVVKVNVNIDGITGDKDKTVSE